MLVESYKILILVHKVQPVIQLIKRKGVLVINLNIMEPQMIIKIMINQILLDLIIKIKDKMNNLLNKLI